MILAWGNLFSWWWWCYVFSLVLSHSPRVVFVMLSWIFCIFWGYNLPWHCYWLGVSFVLNYFYIFLMLYFTRMDRLSMNFKDFFYHSINNPQNSLTFTHIFRTVDNSNCDWLTFFQKPWLPCQQFHRLKTRLIIQIKKYSILCGNLRLKLVNPLLRRFIFTLDIHVM